MKYNHVFPYLTIKPLLVTDDFKVELDQNGIVLIDVGRSFSNANFISFMKRIGNLIEETSAVDQKYIEDKFVLNLKTEINSDISMENEPFSVNSLRFHVERAFADLSKQPNYLALYCINASPDENGGQTIIYPMDKMYRYFSSSDLELMKRMFPISSDRKIVSQNPILNLDSKRGIEYFSYRDLGTYGTDWFVKKCGEFDDGAVKSVADKMEWVLSLYENINALKWMPHYLYIFDNKKYFHGRTEQVRANKRHLKRIRVL